MRPTLLTVLVLCGCRYLGTPMPEVTPATPGLLSNGNPTDPTRQVQAGARRCVVECATGSACNDATATCEPVVTSPVRDAGPAWLP